jgi:hypothetical protein
MRKTVSAALLVAALASALVAAPARAQDGGDETDPAAGMDIGAPSLPRQSVADSMAQAVRIASAAIDRGYGSTCDLKAMPAGTGGYYPCIDIGPYRFVREYAAGSRMAGYLVAGGEPFRFLETSGSAAVLLVKGPWETDLLPRATKYQEDITGATARRKEMLEPESRRVAAERRLQDFVAKERSDTDTEAAKGAAAGQQGTPQR